MDWLKNWNEALDELEQNLEGGPSTSKSWDGWQAAPPTTSSECFPTWPGCLSASIFAGDA